MQPFVNAPISSLLLTLTVLFGWFISDFRVNDAVNAVAVTSVDNTTLARNNVDMYPSTSTPNIDTNWFADSSSNMSYQLTSAQARKNEDDEYVASGGMMGECFGNGDDY